MRIRDGIYEAAASRIQEVEGGAEDPYKCPILTPRQLLEWFALLPVTVQTLGVF